ncbi:type II secretion system protein N [Shewanella sp. SNU WT4]|uniref:type II secretion system protein N n=1 Tax=Shewanella sp. SNU WT4 TaxID=2590015 RepID=UPI001F116A59|nr:type II secretion system protein N [Shewanella sp. SNU WT4]
MLKKLVVFVLLYLVFMVTLFPANVAISWLTLPKNISLSGVSGSVWAGKIAQANIDGRQLDNLSWQLLPAQLLKGQAAAEIIIGNRASAVNGKAWLGYSAAGLALKDVRIEAPLKWIIGNTRLPFRAEAQGDITVMLAGFKQGTPWCEALDGKAFASDLQVNNQFGKYPLGELQVAMSCTDGQVQVAMDEATNGLGISGTAVVGDKMQLVLDAKIRETDTMPSDLKKALSFLGRSDDMGYYPLKFNGRIPGL